MPKVPRASSAPTPEFQRPTPLRAPPSGGGEFVAQATTEAAESISAEMEQIASQEDTVKRVRYLRDLNQRLTEIHTSAVNANEYESIDGTRAVRDRMNEAVAEVTRDFSPQLPESQRQFQVDAERLSASFHAQAVQTGRETANAMLDQQAVQFGNEQAVAVGRDPRDHAVALEAIDAYIERNYAGHASPEREEAMRHAMRAQVANARLGFYRAAGDWAGMEKALSDPLVAPYLDDNAATTARMQIIAGQREEARAAAQAQARGRAAVQLAQEAGYWDDLNDTQKASLQAGFNIGTGRSTRLTLAEKVAQANAISIGVRGRPLSSEEVAKVSGFGVSEKPRETISRLMPKLEDGSITRQGVQDLIQAVRPELDPVTKKPTRDVPGTVYNAFQRHDVDINRILAGGKEGAAETRKLYRALGYVTEPEGREEADVVTAPTPEEDIVVQAAPEIRAWGERFDSVMAEYQGKELTEDDRALILSQLESQEFKGFYPMAEKLTGIQSTLEQRLSGKQYSAWITRSADVRRVRQAWELFMPTLTAAFRKTKRYGDAERTDLLARLRDVQGSFLSSSRALKDSMRGVQIAIGESLLFIKRELDKPDITNERRKEILDLRGEFQTILDRFNFPLQASTKDEVKAALKLGLIKPGDRVEDPKGEFWAAPSLGILEE